MGLFSFLKGGQKEPHKNNKPSNFKSSVCHTDLMFCHAWVTTQLNSRLQKMSGGRKALKERQFHLQLAWSAWPQTFTTSTAGPWKGYQNIETQTGMKSFGNSGQWSDILIVWIIQFSHKALQCTTPVHVTVCGTWLRHAKGAWVSKQWKRCSKVHMDNELNT